MKLNIKTRLFLGFGIILIVLAALGLYSIYILAHVNEKATEINEHWLPGVGHIGSVNTLIHDHRIEEFRHIIAENPEVMVQVEEEMEGINKEIEKEMADYEKTIPDETGREMLENFKNEWAKYLQFNNTMIMYSQGSENSEAMKILQGEAQQSFDKADNILLELIEYNEMNGERVSKEGDEVYASSRNMLLIVIVIAVLFGLIFAYIISGSISNPLKKMEAAAIQLAQGDLTIDNLMVKNKDEIANLADAFNTMKANLREVISQLVASSNEVAESSSQVNSQAQQTSAAASESAATINEIASTVEQVSSNGQKIAMHARKTSDLALQGKNGIEQVTGQMSSIAETTNNVSGIISELANKSKAITQIVDVITNIADQTNLLALNAAIEAARAGEQGRGFAVVAEEVRKLAEQSGHAAGEIRSLITDIQDTSSKSVAAMEMGAKEVAAGSAIVSASGNNFGSIINAVEELSGQMQEIAAATEQMNSAVQNVAASAEEQTAAMEEVGAAVESMSKLAEELNALAAKFKL